MFVGCKDEACECCHFYCIYDSYFIGYFPQSESGSRSSCGIGSAALRRRVDSEIAVRNLERFCEEHLAGRYRIEIVDLTKNPQLGQADQIIALPALVRKRPFPIRKMIGSLSDTEQVLASLDLRLARPAPKNRESCLGTKFVLPRRSRSALAASSLGPLLRPSSAGLNVMGAINDD
jgi:hypothetical protein